MRISILTIVALIMTISPLALHAEGVRPPTIDVEARDLFEKQAHPRLLFSPDDVPTLRQRAKQAPFDKLIESTRRRLAEEEKQAGQHSSILYDKRPRDLATLYLVTGEDEYAQRCAELVERIISDEKYWLDRQSKGLTRAFGAVSVALAYDICHDAWPEDLRKRVSRELLAAAKYMDKSMGAYANTNIANNWQGVRYGAVIIAALASDEPGGRKLADDAFDSLLRHLRANLGNAAWNPEGIGYTTYPWTFTGPAGIVARRAGVGDLREQFDATRHTLWTNYVGSVPIPTRGDELGLHGDLSDDHPALGPRGTTALAFFYAPEKMLPVYRWAYETFFPGDRFDDLWGSGLYTLLLYPAHVEQKNPADVLGLTFVDRGHGVAIFRNQFDDENDIVALVSATQRRPKGGHAGPDTNTFRILGLGAAFVTGAGRTSNPAGQTNLFADTDPPRRGTRDTGRLIEFEANKHGGGRAVATGSCLGVQDHRRVFVADYSGEAGVPALFVNTDTSRNGKLWRLNTPEFNEITFEKNQFFITAPNGATLHGIVLEPGAATFRTGEVERGGGAGHTGFPYRGTKYINNKYLEFDVDGRAAVVMTLTEKKPDPAAVTQALHAAQVAVGDVPIVFDKNTGVTHVGQDAKKTDLIERKTPLRPRGLAARTTGDTTVKLHWLKDDLAAEKLILERAKIDHKNSDKPNKNDAAGSLDWHSVATLEPGASKYTDRDLKPSESYVYRLIAVNDNGRSQPAEPVTATTWKKGFAEYVEDFAPADIRTDNRFGKWTIVESKGPHLRFDAGAGSPRHADAEAGHLSVGSVPIRQARAVYIDGLKADLSGESAQVSFDYKAQAVTVFSPMFKLSDGSWVMCARAYEHSRYAWSTLTFDLHASDMKWWAVDPDHLRRGKELNDFNPAEKLEDVRGVGVYIEWVINRKFAALDQFHLRAREVTLPADKN